MKNDKDTKEKQSPSPMEADLVAVGDDGRYRFRKQSIGLSSALQKEKGKERSESERVDVFHGRRRVAQRRGAAKKRRRGGGRDERVILLFFFLARACVCSCIYNSVITTASRLSSSGRRTSSSTR